MSEIEQTSRNSRRVSLGLSALGCAPLLVAYFVQLWDKPHYRFFPLALAGAGWLAWRGWRSAPTPMSPGSRWVALPLGGVALAALGAGSLLWAPWLGAAAVFLGLVALIWAKGGWKLGRPVLPALAMGLTVLTPPLGWDVALMDRLQGMVMVGASRMLYSFLVPHLMGFSSVELPARKIPLNELFTGLELLPGLLAMCLFYLLLRRRSVVLVVLALAAVVVFALPGEVVRVAFGLRACDATGLDRFANWRNTGTAWGMAVLVFGLMLSVEQLLLFLTDLSQMRIFKTRSLGGVAPAPVPKPEPLPMRPAVLSPKVGQGLAVAVALLALVQVGTGWSHYQSRGVAESALPAGAIPDVEFSLPAALGEWKQVGETNYLAGLAVTTGAKSQRWFYQKGELSLVVAVDFPLRGASSPAMAYRGADWRVSSESLDKTEPGAILPGGSAEMSFDPVLKSVLWYGAVTPRGQWLRPAAPLADRPPAYRVQVLLMAGRKIDPDERKDANEVFEQVRTEWSKQVTEPKTKATP